MAFSNNMSNLLQKLENRLGLLPLKLPEEIAKPTWAERVIIPDTLVTYSRYFPRQFRYKVDAKTHPKKDGWYLLDEDYIGTGAKILGVRDLDFSTFSDDSLALQINAGMGAYDYLSSSLSYCPEDILLAQLSADNLSLFNRGIYVEFQPPNMFRLVNCTNTEMAKSLQSFYILLLLEHDPNLTSLSPTQMETFEALAQCDVAGFLYNYLIHFDQLETVYSQIDLKLQTLETEYGKRDEVINTIKEGYVTAANANQPILLCC